MDGEAAKDDYKQMIKQIRHIKEKKNLIYKNGDIEEKLNKKEKLLNEVSNYHKNARNDHKENYL